MVRVLAQTARGVCLSPPDTTLFLVLWVVYKRMFIIFNLYVQLLAWLLCMLFANMVKATLCDLPGVIGHH